MLPRTARPIALGVGLTGLVGLTGVLAGCTGAAPSAQSYLDGTYAAGGSYTSPGGITGIDVAVQLKDDIISWVLITPGTFVGDPGKFQQQFAAAIPDAVIGKDIDSIVISRIAGSSLTSIAFNQALDKIKREAVEP
jgi:uncharacterized protein with FMN-binding domain